MLASTLTDLGYDGVDLVESGQLNGGVGGLGTAAPVALTDYAYDNLDRLIRVTENLPAGEGGNRVTETVYNADDSVQSVKRAVGTALAQTYAATTFSANGQPLTLTDAKGNRTTCEYDGHDRQIKLRWVEAPRADSAGPMSPQPTSQALRSATPRLQRWKRARATRTGGPDGRQAYFEPSVQRIPQP